MNKKFVIYKHTNLINNKIYIGQTCQKPEYRWGSEGQGYKNSPHFYSAIQKYGWQNFKHEILFTNLTQEQANQKEIELIQKYQSQNPIYGYNSDSGGKAKIPNQKTRLKQSLSAQNRPITTKETKEKLSKINKGRSKTQETKKRMSLAAQQRDPLYNGQSRKVECINTGQVFKSLRAAADWCGLVGVSGISLVCQNKKQKTAGVHPLTKEKLKWRYIE